MTRGRHRIRAATAVAMVVASVGVGAIATGSAGAAGGPWVRVAVPSPNPTGTTLTSIDCAAPMSCTAVGHFIGTRKNVFTSLVIRTTDGVHWTRTPAPSPGSTINWIYGVSCPTANVCIAVGGYLPTDPSVSPLPQALILRTTNGTTWTQVAQPGPNIEGVLLLDISCVDATHCTAVGLGSTGGTTILRTTNGTRWTRGSVPGPVFGGQLQAVDCVSANECTAVGYEFRLNGFNRTLVMRTSDGRTWRRIPSPNPAPSVTFAELDDVDCTTATSCTAVGRIWPASGLRDRAFILQTTDGEAWTRSPTPVDTVSLTLSSVSCSAATECTALGTRGADAAARPYALRTTNGINWSPAGPLPDQEGMWPGELSCPAAQQCFAAGIFDLSSGASQHQRPLVLRET